MATDGVVVEGSSAIDESLLTGEPVPVEVGPGDPLTGGTVNAGGRLVVRAVRVGADTKLAQIARLVHDAQAGKAPVQRLADRVAAVFVPAVIAVAAGTLGFWLGAGESASVAVTAAVAVLIIACPCALGLATPTAIMVGTGRGAQLGIIIKGPEVLESTRAVDTIVLDKTGTVTTGVMSLVAVHAASGIDEGEVLRVAGALGDTPASIRSPRRSEPAPRLPATDLAAVEGFPQHRVASASPASSTGTTVVAGRRSFLADSGHPSRRRVGGALRRCRGCRADAGAGRLGRRASRRRGRRRHGEADER